MKYLTVADVSARLNISPRTVRQWIADGKLAGKRHGKAWEIDAESVAKHLDDNHLASERHDSPDECRLSQQMRSEIDYLRAELTERNRQIESLMQQLDHGQQLLAVQTKTSAALTEQLDASRVMIEDMRQRSSWWQRVFRGT